jgi:hypothetical protein
VERRRFETIFRFADNVPLFAAVDLARVPEKLRVGVPLRSQSERDAIRGLPGLLNVGVQDPEKANLIDVDAKHLVKGVDATPYDFHFRRNVRGVNKAAGVIFHVSDMACL